MFATRPYTVTLATNSLRKRKGKEKRREDIHNISNGELIKECLSSLRFENFMKNIIK